MRTAEPGASRGSSAPQSVGDGVAWLDAQGEVVFASGIAELVFGVNESDNEAETWRRHFGVFLADGSTRCAAGDYPHLRVLRGEPSATLELFVRNSRVPDGVQLTATALPLRNASGHITGASVVFRDITALRLTEQALRRASAELRDAQRRRSELRSAMLQELDPPLTNILANVACLLDKAVLAREHAACLRDIQQSVRAAQRILERPSGGPER